MYLSKAYLVFLNNNVLSYSLIFIFYLLLNLYFADVLHAASQGMEDMDLIRSTIDQYQGEVESYKYELEQQGLNKDDNLLSEEERSLKASYLEALHDAKGAVKENIKKLSILKSGQAGDVETLGKRPSSETTGGVAKYR